MTSDNNIMNKPDQLYIPEKICVGAQKREGTYTGKLAYVIYYRDGILRKEKSWQSWRDKSIPSIDFTNEPTEGFVLNKGVGGQRYSYGWNCRSEYIRVWDPRDFEFEISVANLLFILRECSCNKGKGLEGKFVYAWDGTELVLLPECSTDYHNSRKFSDLQHCSVKSKEMIPGATYITKKQDALIYVGRFDYHFVIHKTHWHPNAKSKGVAKKHVFWDGKSFVFLGDLKTIAAVSCEAPVANYAELVDKYNRSPNGSKVIRLFTVEEVEPKLWVVPEGDGFVQCRSSNWDNRKCTTTQNRIRLVDGVIVAEEWCHNSCQEKNARWSSYDLDYWIPTTKLRLFAELANGCTYAVNGGSLVVA